MLHEYEPNTRHGVCQRCGRARDDRRMHPVPEDFDCDCPTPDRMAETPDDDARCSCGGRIDPRADMCRDCGDAHVIGDCPADIGPMTCIECDDETAEAPGVLCRSCILRAEPGHVRPVELALAVVIDAGGDILYRAARAADWWRGNAAANVDHHAPGTVQLAARVSGLVPHDASPGLDGYRYVARARIVELLATYGYWRAYATGARVPFDELAFRAFPGDIAAERDATREALARRGVRLTGTVRPGIGGELDRFGEPNVGPR